MTPHEDNPGQWIEYQRLVLGELKRLGEGQERTAGAISALREDMVALKIKSGVWGLIAGAIPASVMVAFHYFKGSKN